MRLLKCLMFVFVLVVLAGGVQAVSCGDYINQSINLTGNLDCSGGGDGLVINDSGITIDCKGFQIIGNGSGNGIVAKGNDGYYGSVNIKNCRISNFDTGINEVADHCEIDNNTIYNCNTGIAFYNDVAWDTIVKNNKINTTTGYGIYGLTDGEETEHVYKNNIINSDAGGIYLDIDDSKVINNTINAKTYGISVSADNTSITNNTIHSEDVAIILMSSNNLVVNNSAISQNSFGIQLSKYYSENNCMIYNNYFSSAYGDGINNTWNTTKDCSKKNIIGGNCTGGNYYENYFGYDSNNPLDGIGDTLIGDMTNFAIKGGSNVDYLPLTNRTGLEYTEGNFTTVKFYHAQTGECDNITWNNWVVASGDNRDKTYFEPSKFGYSFYCLGLDCSPVNIPSFSDECVNFPGDSTGGVDANNKSGFCYFSTNKNGQIANKKCTGVDHDNPLIPTINETQPDSGTNITHQTNRIYAQWNSTDNESGIQGYLYNIYSVPDNKYIANCTIEWAPGYCFTNKTALWINTNTSLVNGGVYRIEVLFALDNVEKTSSGGDYANVKAEFTCDDSIKNQNESDIDCGGSCQKCISGMDCLSDSDCLSGICSGGVCATTYLGVEDENIAKEINYSAGSDVSAVQFLLFYPPGADVDLHVYDSNERHVGYNRYTNSNEIGFPASYSGKYSNPEIIYIPNAANKNYSVVAELAGYNSNLTPFINLYALEIPFRDAVLAATPIAINKSINKTQALELSVVIGEAGCQKPLRNVSIDIGDLSYNGNSLNFISPKNYFIPLLPACTSQGIDFVVGIQDSDLGGDYTGQIALDSSDTSAQTINVLIEFIKPVVNETGNNDENNETNETVSNPVFVFKTATCDYDAEGFVYIDSTITVDGITKQGSSPPHYKAVFNISSNELIKTDYSAPSYKPDTDYVYFDKRLESCAAGNNCSMITNSEGYATLCTDLGNEWNSMQCNVTNDNFGSIFVYFPDEKIVQRVNYLQK